MDRFFHSFVPFCSVFFFITDKTKNKLSWLGDFYSPYVLGSVVRLKSTIFALEDVTYDYH